MPRAPATDHPYTVELWTEDSQSVLETLATAGSFALARAAYDEAVRRHPGRPVTVRQGIRVILDSDLRRSPLSDTRS